MTKITVLGWDVVRYPAQTIATRALGQSQRPALTETRQRDNPMKQARSDVALTVCRNGP